MLSFPKIRRTADSASVPVRFRSATNMVTHGSRTGRTVALVTASSSGLGKASAKALAREGAHVVINGRDEQRLADAVEQIGDPDAFGDIVAFLLWRHRRDHRRDDCPPRRWFRLSLGSLWSLRRTVGSHSRSNHALSCGRAGKSLQQPVWDGSVRNTRDRSRNRIYSIRSTECERSIRAGSTDSYKTDRIHRNRSEKPGLGRDR